jgi:hypothetical protein
MPGCANGSRVTGVSFDDFRQHGVTTDWLRATGDAMAMRLAEAVECAT